jgi:hypothetical protein
VADSNSIVLCFSPAKIKKGIAPFTLALRYSEYDDKVLYLPVLDTLLPDDVRYALIQYSETEGVTGIRTDFVINIGRYNIILQAKSDAPALYGGNQPNYVSALYFGADPLISSLLQDPTVMCMFMFQNNAVGTGSWQYNYVDQLQLLNEFDVKLAKDR